MFEDIYTCITELTPFCLEFVDENGDFYALESYVKSVFDEYILIAPPHKDGVACEIPDNTEIKMFLTINGKAFVADSMVISKELGTQSGIRISFPYNAKNLERREYIRVAMKLMIEVTCYHDAARTNRFSFSTKTRDISGSGVSFFHKASLDNYYDIQCKIFLNDGNPSPIIVRCDLIYSKILKIKGEMYYLTALTYTSISNPDRSRIVKECFKYQVSHKKIED